MPDPELSARMREDWNARAREDLEYYVAFGRPDTGDFFSTASDVVRNLDLELRRAPAAERSQWRALEIGCGPARLMRPMAGRFAEIHGIDVSDEMIRRARENLAGIPNARVHLGDGSRLTEFPDEWFDFVYSYAVFQHIPSAEAVYEYLREMRRVLKAGGLARLHFNGLPCGFEARYDTWSGARFTSAEILEFTESHDFQVLALEGASTQYLWTTWRKQPGGWCEAQRQRSFAPDTARIRRITNASSSEPLAPCRGHFSAISLLVEDLPPEAGLHHLRVAIGDSLGTVAYVGPLDNIGLRQVMVLLPDLEATGLLPVELRWLEQPIAPQATVRVIPPGPMVPCIKSVTDGRNLMAGTRIESRTVKVTLEEVARPEEIEAVVDGLPVADVSYFCTDPRPQRFEYNFRLPEEIAPGEHALEMRIGRRRFAPVMLQVMK